MWYLDRSTLITSCDVVTLIQKSTSLINKHYNLSTLNNNYTHTHTRFTAPWILSGTTRVSRYHSHLLWSSFVPYLLHPSITIHGILPVQFTCLTAFINNLSPSFLWSRGRPLGLAHLLHTSYISSPNHCLLFTAHARTIATCFAVVPRLCDLILLSLSNLYLELYVVASCHTSI